MRRLHLPSRPAIGLLSETCKCFASVSTVNAWRALAALSAPDSDQRYTKLTIDLKLVRGVTREDAIEEHVVAGHGESFAAPALPWCPRIFRYLGVCPFRSSSRIKQDRYEVEVDEGGSAVERGGGERAQGKEGGDTVHAIGSEVVAPAVG